VIVLLTLQFKHGNTTKISKQISQNHRQRTSYVNDTLHHDLNVLCVRDEIKRLSQRYADRMEEHPNVLAIDLTSDAETRRI